MTRYVIMGAGAVGASLAAQFELAGINYALIGRGAQIQHLKKQGLSYQRPNETRQVSLNAFDLADLVVLTSNDILLLTVKSQDATDALAYWSWRTIADTQSAAATTLPIVTFQNGVATEAAALRTFSRVYGASILTPARFTETGKVVVGGDPQVGIVTVGHFPFGEDEISEKIARDLNRADYLADSTPDIRRWKSAKLLHNVLNALELFDGPAELRSPIAEAIVEETRLALTSAGYQFASPSERKKDISKWRVAPNSGIEAGQQSTWQSFKRGTSNEIDYLNGEVVLLGRLHGVATPFNAAIQALAAKLANEGDLSNRPRLEAINALVNGLPQTISQNRTEASR
ncbi:ketopantoate reductase family protein (plasmid) [Agrobacterium sp. rho-8.1]|nr:2-dehydropantoate 2-reductase N-terminal domain-containing protein [Agrobacterium sp. rho-8.1]